MSVHSFNTGYGTADNAGYAAYFNDKEQPEASQAARRHLLRVILFVMLISSETWAIVAATGLGPVVAVGITLWRETVTAKYNRRLHVFRTLMATRRASISAEHVNALNLIEVDFYGEKNVEIEWKNYKDHLYTSTVEDDAWREKKENLLAKLLFEIGKVLRFDIPAIDIYKGGYAPKGWAFRDSRQTRLFEYFYEMSQGRNALPVSGVAQPKSWQPQSS